MSVQPGLRGSNDLRVGRKMATFQLFFQSGRAKDLSGPLHAQLFLPHKIVLHRKQINNGTHGNDVGLIHTNCYSCPWASTFPLVRNPLPCSILVTFRTADPVSILYLLPNLKLPLPLSISLVLWLEHTQASSSIIQISVPMQKYLHSICCVSRIL